MLFSSGLARQVHFGLHMIKRALLPSAAALLGAAPALAVCPAIEALQPQITQEITRETPGFTQGLVYHQGMLYESTGSYAERSVINRIDPDTGKVLVAAVTPRGSYGEGLALIDRRFVQLTWNDGVAFVYDRDSLKHIATKSIPGAEGWGLARLGSELVMSDGSATLRILDPKNFTVTRTLEVKTTAGDPLNELNELEVARGMIFANIWHHGDIAVIDPASGCVRARVSLSPLLNRLDPTTLNDNPENVANGIAYDPSSDQFFLTGKNWPKIFKVRIAP